MTRREAWFTAIGLFALGAVVRAVAAAAIPFPIPEDTAYYYDVARNVVEGHGLVADALWSFQTPARDPVTGALGLFVPRPAFEVWLPLPTLLAILPMSLFGTSYGASLVVQVLVAALVPVLAWRIAADVAEELDLPRGRARSLALGTGILAAIFGPLVLHGAILDSTAPFAACALAACLLMVRLVRTAPPSLLDLRLVGLGTVLALAAYTRNEVAWLALTWVLVAWFMARDPSGARATRSDRLRLILVPAAVAVALFSPWLVRNWLVFGNPLPGQAVANAFSIAGFDIFAWADPPTFARYLAAGPATWVAHRVTALEHNLVTVLLIPAIPVGPVGLLALPWTGRARALRPLLVLSVLTFAITTLFFPVATTWGTFLHAAGPVHVLLLISCLLAFDRVIVKVGAMRGWTRPVAWLGPAFVGFMALLVVVLTVTSYGALARQVSSRYEELAGTLQTAGGPLAPGEPIVANHPIWLAAVARVPTLALPDETPTDVVDLARTFGARILVIDGNEHGSWPGILAEGGPDADCFHAIEIDSTTRPALKNVRAYRIDCP